MTTTVDLLAGVPEPLSSHLAEIAGESGMETTVSMSNEFVTTDGIEVWYDENACHWEAWKKGVGGSSGYSQEEAIESLRKKELS